MKKYHIIYIVCTLLLCCVLSLGTLLSGPQSPAANETPAPLPALTDKDGHINDHYLTNLVSWFGDRYFLRKELITLHAEANATVGHSASDSVILGKNGWLYFADTLPDYTGTRADYPRDLYAAAHNLQLMQQHCAANGIDFLFVCVPNKNTLYPDSMPSLGAAAGIHDMERLSDILTDMGVPIADIKGAFSAEPDCLYFAHDSHWNSRGAALGADVILTALGRQSGYFMDPFSETQAHTGDLFQMLFPAGIDPETAPVYGGTLSFDYAKNSGRKPDSITIRTESSADGSLLMYRDSFGNNLYPYLADSFGKAEFSRSSQYDLTLTNDELPDTIIIELVERNLHWLAENIPLMPAPMCTEAVDAGSGSISLTAALSPKFPGYLLWQGTAEETDWDSPVLIVTDGGVYACFLTENDGFAAWLPEGTEVRSVCWIANGNAVVRNAQ